METLNVLSSKSIKRFTKTLFAVTAVFAVFSCGFAAIVLYFGKDFELDIQPLIFYLSISPFIVFFILIIFQCFVTNKCKENK